MRNFEGKNVNVLRVPKIRVGFQTTKFLQPHATVDICSTSVEPADALVSTPR